eukprot:10767223-Karenia_brevis.AAC.1
MSKNQEANGESSGSSKPGARCNTLPYEQRTIARFGNLGWDQEGALLENKAKTLLTELGVSGWRNVSACRKQGGSA